MAGVVPNNLNFKKGHCLALTVLIPKDAKGFCINMGKDSNHFLLHLNPRFNQHGDVNTIVCNPKGRDTWGVEQREAAFPFIQGEVTKICFEDQGDSLKVKLSNGQEITFPARMTADNISFVSLEGIDMKSISLE